MSEDLLDTPEAGAAAARGGALRAGGYGVGVLVTVVSAAVLFRHLGVDEGGRYVLVLSIATLAAGITDAGLSSIGVRELSIRAPGDRRSFVRNLLGLRIAFSLAGAGAACLYAALAGLGDRLVLGTLIAAVGVLMTNLQSTYATSLMAELRFGWVTLIELGRQVLTAAGILLLAAAGAGLVPFLAVAPVAGLAAAVTTAVLVRRAMPLLPRLDPTAWRELLRQTIPFALAAAVAAVYFRFAILMVDLLSDDRETGLFGASFRIVEVLVTVPIMVVQAALPIFARAARDDLDRLRYGLGVVLHAMTLLGCVMLVGLVAGAPVAIEVVAGPRFDDAVPVLRLHAVALLLTFASAPWGFALLSTHRHGAVLRQSLGGLVVLGVGVAVLVPTLGAEGGALATIAGEATLFTLGLVFVRRAGLPVPCGWLPRVVAVTGVALLPVLLLPALPATVLGLLLLGGGLLAVRAVPGELLALIPGRGTPTG